jgi:ankyrin repeat protein
MVHTELKRMPETLDQTYDRILQAVPGLHQPFVQSALHWLAFATRPLQLQELAEASVVDPDGETFNADHSRLFDENLILELCGPLVTSSTVEYNRSSTDWLTDKISAEVGQASPALFGGARTEFSVVSLSHFSVKEYIASPRLQKGALSSYHASRRLANSFLAKSCLIYLLNFNGGEIATNLDFREWPLLEYSARNWMSHWKQASPANQQPELRDLAERLFDPLNSNAYVNWLNVSVPDATLERGWFRSEIYRREMKTGAHGYPQTLYWAASLGDVALVQSLLEQGGDVTAREGNFESALGAAAYHGHSDVVDCLLQHGADSNLASMQFGTVLQLAALGGSVKVVKQLLDAGASVNAQGGGHNTALVAAASKEHYDVVALLVKHGADLNVSSRDYGSSLYQVALAGDTKTAVALLGAGADINEIGQSDGTALYAAALAGSILLVQLLLRRGADVNKGGKGEFGYPVSAAAQKGHSQVVRVLTRAGANVNVCGGHRGVPALESAVESRDIETFRAVLDAGADPNIQGSLYHNCFHAAIYTGEFAMAKILLERDAHFEDEAFMHAVELYGRHPWFLDKLLEKNPNVDAWKQHGGSALHLAVKNLCEEAIWLLLAKNPYIDAASEDGSVLSCAIDKGLKDVVKELLRRGADPNRQVGQDTPFSQAILDACAQGKGDLELADLLLEKGADIDGGNGLSYVLPDPHNACLC